MSKSIAAVVLNYRTPDDTVLAVRSLQAASQPVRPIVVVDNGSGDDSVERLRELGDVELVALRANSGFPAGSNAGIRRALDSSPGAVLLANSDVVVPPHTIAGLAEVLERDARVGIAGPLVRSRANPDVIESAGISYHVQTGRMRLLRNGERAHLGAQPDANGAVEVEAVSGCAMLVRAHVFQDVGLLAEGYFFGFEDIDFCLRARMRGWETRCDPSVFVLHEGHRSIGRRSARRIYFATRNHLTLASRFPATDSRGVRWGRLAAVTGLNLAAAVRGGAAGRLSGVGAWATGVADFMRGRSGAG